MIDYFEWIATAPKYTRWERFRSNLIQYTVVALAVFCIASGVAVGGFVCFQMAKSLWGM